MYIFRRKIRSGDILSYNGTNGQEQDKYVAISGPTYSRQYHNTKDDDQNLTVMAIPLKVNYTPVRYSEEKHPSAICIDVGDGLIYDPIRTTAAQTFLVTIIILCAQLFWLFSR